MWMSRRLGWMSTLEGGSLVVWEIRLSRGLDEKPGAARVTTLHGTPGTGKKDVEVTFGIKAGAFYLGFI